ncbi:MAG TPA: NAD(P)/FAD-dependent oxidoreductase [Nitrososphaerales archaeon]|nr:NAD(P)/FAD-dependent oxidoreductase [Nitrososphaerales archaeon]
MPSFSDSPPSERYDVVVGGGSVAGLAFAAEATKRGLSVLVLEEDKEIGEPEKCDGLVSLQELRRYAMPDKDCIQSRVSRGTVFSPSGRKASLDASKMDVVVIDRSAFDKQLAANAEVWGAEVRTGARVTGVEERPEEVRVAAGQQTFRASYYVDATGPAGVMKFNRQGLVPTAKYEVEGDWFVDGEIEVYTDQERYPGFFAWVIPRGAGIAKVGAAGFGINAAKALEDFLSTRQSRVVSKVACTIYVGGPIEQFVSGRTLYVGESAGQVKPTTAGGIPSSVAGGVIAARWVSDSIQLKDPALIARYQPDWSGRYGKEYRLMTRLRHIYENLSNRDLDKLVATLDRPKVASKLAAGSFDFHATAAVSALGVTGILQLAGVLVSSEAKQAVASLVRPSKR